MPSKILFISGSIGLGHVGRDLVIARELRQILPDLEISWLAAGPAARILELAGEPLIPESAEFCDVTSTADVAATDYSLSLVAYFVKVKRAWKKNFKVFCKIVKNHELDLVLGDEAYEVWLRLADRPDVLSVPFVMLYDFMGFDIQGRGLMDRLGGVYVNRLWTSTDRKIAKREQGIRQFFVGEENDVPDDKLGPFLPTARAHALEHYEFVGNIVSFDPDDYADRHGLRESLGWGPTERVIVATSGGSAVGKGLLDLCARSYPLIRERCESARMVIVCGPRIDPASVEQGTEGCVALGYVPRLYEYLAAADLTITHGGGGTTTELVALNRPFIYLPIQGHTEQERSVSFKLESIGAGRRLDYASTSADTLAATALEEISRSPNYPLIPTRGARVIAERVARLLR